MVYSGLIFKKEIILSENCCKAPSDKLFSSNFSTSIAIPIFTNVLPISKSANNRFGWSLKKISALEVDVFSSWISSISEDVSENKATSDPENTPESMSNTHKSKMLFRSARMNSGMKVAKSKNILSGGSDSKIKDLVKTVDHPMKRQE